MVALSPLAGAGWQFFGSNGLPLAGGKLFTYAAGTTTPAATYTSSSGITPHANPIVLDSAGRVPSEVWLTSSASYKFILKTAANVEIWTKDNIPGIVSAADLLSTAAGGGIDMISRVPYPVSSRTAMKALDTTRYTVAMLNEGGRSGTFFWQTGNYSAQIALDTQEGIYVKANAVSASLGAWVRNTTVLTLPMFGGACNGTTNDTAAVRGMLATAQSGTILQFATGPNQKIGISDDGGGDADALFLITDQHHGCTFEMGSFGKDQSDLGPYFKLLGDISKSIFKIDGTAGRQPSVTIDLGFSGYIDGVNRRAVAGACIYHKAGDICTYRRLTGGNIAGGLLWCVRAVKCHFNNINSQTCGATGYPAIKLDGSNATIGTQGSAFVNVRVENTVNAEAFVVGSFDRANKFFGLTFESSGGITVGDFNFLLVNGYNNQFYGVTMGQHEGLTVAKAKLQDNGQGNQFFGVGCTLGTGFRTTGDEINLAGSRTILSGVQGFANAGLYDIVLVRTAAASTGVAIRDVYAFQCNALSMDGNYGTADTIKAQLPQGTFVVVNGFQNQATNITTSAGYATAAPFVQITGVDCAATGRIAAAAFGSTATAAVHLTSAAQRARVDFDIDGSCTALGNDFVSQGIWVEANDTNVKARVRRVGQNAIRYGNVRVGTCYLERCESWGFQAANTYAAVEKTGATIAYGGTIRVGNLYPPSGAYTVAQTNWLKVLDNAGAPSWQKLYAYADCAPGLTASITAHASNVIGQGVT